MAGKNHGFDRVVLVLQGGGARGAYHLGAYKAMEEAGYTPDVYCGISIGALSACVLAGNDDATRYGKLEEFWNEITWPEFLDTSKVPMNDAIKKWHNQMASLQAVMFGQPNFFTPWFPPPQFQAKGTSAATSYYDTSKLKDTLTRLSNFDLFNKQKKTRLVTGATRIKTGELAFFDSANAPLTVDNVVASGSLPPGFPGTRINGDLYW
ncbi:MAG: patatin-like phospholipase family protein, partial [Candidatus Nucleicultricaceae bacterium]